MFGFLNINKPKGMTSHDVVAVLRRITKEKQIGHTGTLDPFAEGVLPVAIGKTTRLIEYLDDDKAYIGTVKFGSATDTYDIEGQLTKTSDKEITFEELDDVLEQFRGDISQLPPIYSAIKVNGKKLYEYARKGEEVEIQSRNVRIERLDILSFDEIEKTAELFIECSKGTYIRSLANDIGEKLNTYGHLIKLERVKAGQFMIRKSVKLEDLKTKEDVEKNLLKPLDYLNYPKYELNDYEKEKVSHGNPIEITMPDGLVVLTYNNELISVAEITNGVAKSKKVMI